VSFLHSHEIANLHPSYRTGQQPGQRAAKSRVPPVAAAISASCCRCRGAELSPEPVIREMVSS
jgi:hypothetical protein